MSNFSRKKIILIITLILILLAVPLTIFLTQQQQDLRQRAAGTPLYSPPANYSTWSTSCFEEVPLVAGLRGCVTQKGFNGKAYGKVRNTTTNQTFTVGMASYKAYILYPNPYPSCDISACPSQHEWLWTQTYHDGVTASLGPGQTVYFEVNVPSCAWQTDIFKGNIMQTFSKPNGYYGGQGNFIDGWYEDRIPVCSKTTPTPTRIPTPTPTKLPTPTPTRIPTPTPKLPTLTLTANPTSVAYNGSSTLSWSSVNTTSCTASNGWTGAKAVSGSQTTGALTSSRSYTITCTGPGGSITKSATVTVGAAPTPTKLPTPTPTKIPTPTPTRIPTPTPTIPPSATKFSLTVFMHGLGNSGDNANPTAHSLSNKNPLHKNRSVVFEVYNASNSLVLTRPGAVIYNEAQGNFTGTVDAGTTLTSGNYTIKVKSTQYLKRRIPGIINVKTGSTVSLPAVTFVTGDVNNDNALNILDYNLIVGCYSDFGPAVSCTAQQKLSTDLTDDGKVNQFDYNLFLRDLSVQSGD